MGENEATQEQPEKKLTDEQKLALEATENKAKELVDAEKNLLKQCPGVLQPQLNLILADRAQAKATAAGKADPEQLATVNTQMQTLQKQLMAIEGAATELSEAKAGLEKSVADLQQRLSDSSKNITRLQGVNAQLQTDLAAANAKQAKVDELSPASEETGTVDGVASDDGGDSAPA